MLSFRVSLVHQNDSGPRTVLWEGRAGYLAEAIRLAYHSGLPGNPAWSRYVEWARSPGLLEGTRAWREVPPPKDGWGSVLLGSKVSLGLVWHPVKRKRKSNGGGRVFECRSLGPVLWLQEQTPRKWVYGLGGGVLGHCEAAARYARGTLLREERPFHMATESLLERYQELLVGQVADVAGCLGLGEGCQPLDSLGLIAEGNGLRR